MAQDRPVAAVRPDAVARQSRDGRAGMVGRLWRTAAGPAPAFPFGRFFFNDGIDLLPLLARQTQGRDHLRVLEREGTALLQSELVPARNLLRRKYRQSQTRQLAH